MAKKSFTRMVIVSYKNNKFHLASKNAWIFVHGHYLFYEAYTFPRASKNKYLFTVLQIFFSPRAGLKIGEYYSGIPQFWPPGGYSVTCRGENT